MGGELSYQNGIPNGIVDPRQEDFVLFSVGLTHFLSSWTRETWVNKVAFGSPTGNMSRKGMAVGQNHFGVGAPPILVHFSGDWDVHWGHGLLAHGHMKGTKRVAFSLSVSCPCSRVNP